MSSMLVKKAFSAIVTVIKFKKKKRNGLAFHTHFYLVLWVFISFFSNVINSHQDSSSGLVWTCSLCFQCFHLPAVQKKNQLALLWIFHVNASGSNTNIFIVRLITSGLTFCKSCLALGRISLLLMRSGKVMQHSYKKWEHILKRISPALLNTIKN